MKTCLLLIATLVLVSIAKDNVFEATGFQLTGSGPEANFAASVLHNNNDEDAKGWLVEFYAPWCGHCASFQKTYDSLAVTSERDGTFNVGQVDITNFYNSEIVKKYEITSFPSLLYFDVQSGNHFKHSGDNTEDELLLFIDRCSSDAVTVLRTVADVRDFFAVDSCSTAIGQINVVGNVNLAVKTFSNLAINVLAEIDPLLRGNLIRFATVDKYHLLKDFWRVMSESELTNDESNYYEILDVDRSANVKQIKKAFRKLSKSSHPDKHHLHNITKADAEASFQKMTEAHHVLTDSALRAKYDEYVAIEGGVRSERTFVYKRSVLLSFFS